MAVLKVAPEAMEAICRELDQVSLDTKIIIQKYIDILNKLNTVWEGEAQVAFKCAVTDHLQDMQRLTEICGKYRIELSNVIRCYEETEGSLVNDLVRGFD